MSQLGHKLNLQPHVAGVNKSTAKLLALPADIGTENYNDACIDFIKFISARTNFLLQRVTSAKTEDFTW